MLKIEIPGQEDLTVKNIVFDYNLRSGTESEPSYTTFL